MPISGVRLGGGPEYQLPSQETLVLAKAAVIASVSAPLTMMPRFVLFVELVAGAAVGDATGAAAAVTVEEVLEVGATTGAAATVAGVSATAEMDVLELGSTPIAVSVMAEFTVGNSVLELASMGEGVMDSTGERVPA